MSLPRPASEPANLRERAYDAFRQRIFARDVKPGQFVTQRELVELTGVPLGAIRELVPRLEAEGLIVTIPQRGMQVAHADLGLIRGAFQFRLFMEREAAMAYAVNASAADIAAQRAAHEEIRETSAAGITQPLIDHAQHVDLAFHEAIIDHLGNEIISNAFRVNWIKIKLIRQNETKLYADIVLPVFRDHMRVIEAIERKDAEAAVAAMTAHINMSRARAIDMG
jgi:DNA-binding GntR family transcriptional regulator